MSRRCLSTGFGLTALILLGTIGWLKADSLPEGVRPGDRTNSAKITKERLLAIGGVGLVTDIRVAAFESADASELGIAGNYGARFFDQGLNLKSAVDFVIKKPDGFPVASEIVMPSTFNNLLFFRRAGDAATYDSVTNGDGKELWRTPYHPPASVFCEFDSGSPPEFIFSTPDASVEARSLSGAVLWRAPVGHSVFQIVALPSTKTSPATIVANVSGKVVEISADGRLTSERALSVKGFLSSLSAIKWPSVCDACLLVSADDGFHLFSAEGKEIGLLAPAKYLQHAHGISVRLSRNGAPVLAIAGLIEYKTLTRLSFF